MPTYAYHCEQCQHNFDAFQKITDGALSKCPNCGKDALKRGVGGGSATFHFKGSGFYITDYKNGQPSKSESSGSCCPCNKKDGSCGT